MALDEVLIAAFFYILRSCKKKKIVEEPQDTHCSYSPEAKRVGLQEFLEKVMEGYFKQLRLPVAQNAFQKHQIL